MIHDNSSQQVAGAGNQSIRVGAFGWQHDRLVEGFYPADLPEDWRISFYANEFSAVLVPTRQWLDEELDLQEWLDVPENFRYYLQATAEPCDSRLVQLKLALGDHYAGLVEHVDGRINEPGGAVVIDMQSRSLREWRDWLTRHAATLRVVFLNHSELDYQQLADFKSLLELLGL